MLKIACPNCYSDNVNTDDKKMERLNNGKDYFKCEDCKSKFPLSKISYTK